MLDEQSKGGVRNDARSIVLSYGSRLILERLGAWHLLADTTPINHIVVSQHRGFGNAELTAREARVPALGYVASYALLKRALTSALEQTTVRALAGCAMLAVSGDTKHAAVVLACDDRQHETQAKLVAIADGGKNPNPEGCRTHDYRQAALVCDITSEQPHRNRAFERFTCEGPLALLPTLCGWSLVWTAMAEHAQTLANCSTAEF